MAFIKVVIEIPESDYKFLKEKEKKEPSNLNYIARKIVTGTVLPKGHGRLIDAKEYENSIRKHYFDNHTVIRCTEIALYSAETIVEADKN